MLGLQLRRRFQTWILSQHFCQNADIRIGDMEWACQDILSDLFRGLVALGYKVSINSAGCRHTFLLRLAIDMMNVAFKEPSLMQDDSHLSKAKTVIGTIPPG